MINLNEILYSCKIITNLIYYNFYLRHIHLTRDFIIIYHVHKTRVRQSSISINIADALRIMRERPSMCNAYKFLTNNVNYTSFYALYYRLHASVEKI